MADEKYNGWSNYETWNVNLWLSNDEGLYRHTKDLAESQTTEPTALAMALEDFVKEIMPEVDGMASDLLTHALGRVDWDEIARAWLEA